MAMGINTVEGNVNQKIYALQSDLERIWSALHIIQETHPGERNVARLDVALGQIRALQRILTKITSGKGEGGVLD